MYCPPSPTAFWASRLFDALGASCANTALGPLRCPAAPVAAQHPLPTAWHVRRLLLTPLPAAHATRRGSLDFPRQPPSPGSTGAVPL